MVHKRGWCGWMGEGRRKLIIGVVYLTQEGVRVEEMERLFEVMHVDVMKYEEKGFDVIGGEGGGGRGRRF